MPSIRIGFSTDLNLVNEQVGIGTTLPTARLDVRGQIRADNSSGSGGISTLTTYDGFLHSQQGIGNTISIAATTKGNLNSLSGEVIVIKGEVTVAAGTSIGAGRLDSLTITGSFDLPRGGSANREATPEKGSTRFNQDLGQLEFYTGYEWRTVSSYDGSGRGRGVFAGGETPTLVSNIDYIQISTLGNAVNFGNLLVLRQNPGAVSSSIRGVFAGGETPSNVNNIEYITLASEGNAIDFGDLAQSGAVNNVARYKAGCGSSTRGLYGSGSTPATSNVIEYITINTLGNSLDFGDLLTTGLNNGACSSPTRGIFADSQLASFTIQFVTIASTGNAVYFGDLTHTTNYDANRCCSNSIRGINFGGGPSPLLNVIDYITIATTGNAIRFGDLTQSRLSSSGTASQIRGIFAGGASPTRVNTIDYITIMTTGNAQDFGDLTIARAEPGACSDSHGGLGGF